MSEVHTPEELYGLDPAQFTAARDSLVRRLRADGDAEQARRVAALRRPSKSVWALNVLARERPEHVDAVLGTAQSVRTTIAAGAADSDDATTNGAEVRRAQRGYQDAVDRAVQVAAEQSGVDGDAMRTRMRNTLFAAGADDTVAQELRGGTLRVDLDAPGFTVVSPSGEGIERSEGRTRRERVEQLDRGPSQRRRRRLSSVDSEPPRDTTTQDTTTQDTTTQDTTTQDTRARDTTARDEGVSPARGHRERARRQRAREQRDLEREVHRLRQRADRLVRQAENAETAAAEARKVAAEARKVAAEARKVAAEALHSANQARRAVLDVESRLAAFDERDAGGSDRAESD